MAEQKTNVMRLLEQRKIRYRAHSYPHGDEAVDGEAVAALLGRAPACVFKTLVTRGASKACYVFVIPVAGELALKKAAGAVGEKSVSLLPLKELTAVTGYVRGGCSPIGMKKPLRTVLDQSCLRQESILVSAGRIGQQVELSPQDLIGLIGAETADITTED